MSTSGRCTGSFKRSAERLMLQKLPETADLILAYAGRNSQSADSDIASVEDSAIASEEADSCKEPEESNVLLVEVWRHSCHAENQCSFQGLKQWKKHMI